MWVLTFYLYERKGKSLIPALGMNWVWTGYVFIFNKLYRKENRQKLSIPINKNLQGVIYFI